jgi:hypothetical protein
MENPQAAEEEDLPGIGVRGGHDDVCAEALLGFWFVTQSSVDAIHPEEENVQNGEETSLAYSILGGCFVKFGVLL